MDRETLRTHDFSRILLIKLSAFGDVIHTIPTLHQLRRRYPAARIDWLTKPANAELIRHHPALDRVVLFDDEPLRHPLRSDSRPAHALLTLLRELRGGRYDLVIDLQAQARSAFCAVATGAKVRIGFDRPRAHTREASPRKLPATAYRHAWMGAREGSWLAYTDRIELDTIDLHAVDRYLRLGRLLGFEPAPVDFSFPIAAEAQTRADDLLRAEGRAAAPSERRYVLLAPGSLWETKRWTPDGFAAVARHFLAEGTAVVLAGGGRDREACSAIEARAPGVVNLCAKTSLAELAAVMRNASLVIANDSGPMHLAVALGRPVAALFGPTEALWVGPYGQPDAVVSLNLPCAPCYLRTLRQCPYGHACMRDLAAEPVIARAAQALSAARPAVMAASGL